MRRLLPFAVNSLAPSFFISNTAINKKLSSMKSFLFIAVYLQFNQGLPRLYIIHKKNVVSSWVGGGLLEMGEGGGRGATYERNKNF